jgi:hypothetical protein
VNSVFFKAENFDGFHDGCVQSGVVIQIREIIKEKIKVERQEYGRNA